MYSIRKVLTKSGATAIQIVQYIGHSSKIIKHIGSAKNEDEISTLRQLAKNWIDEQTHQTSLFPKQRQRILYVDRGECIGVTHHFAYQFLNACLEECQLAHLPKLLKDLAIMRLIGPASKLWSITLLKRYFGIKYSRRIYLNIPKLIVYKSEIEQCTFQIAQNKFKEPFYFVLYDVTTLYFESFKSDELKNPGFSKDNKSQQTQIVIGLLVTQSGFPLTYEVFAGKTFEGNTMIPIIENFTSSHPNTKPIVVADAAMLDDERLAQLRLKKMSYIVGARLANANLNLIKQISVELQGKEGAITRFHSRHGYLVCDFSLKRYKKELNDLNKLIQKAEELVAKQSSGSRTRFIRKISKEKIELNIELIEKRKLLLGIKGYCTDLSESELSNELVISRYHQLWHIEQSFRMSKNDIETRPVYHQNELPIRSHILICFVGLILEKYLELTTKLSLREIRLLIWDITESHIKDKLTEEIFEFRSPIDQIMKSPLADLIKNWGIIPH